MRTKAPADRLSKKMRMGSDAAVLVALMRRQPLEKRDLIREAKIDDSTFSRVEPLLLSRGLIGITNDKYHLFNYEGGEELEEIFKKFVKDSKYLVTLEEVADLVGRSPEGIKDQAYKMGHRYGVHIYYNNYVSPGDHINIF